MFCQYCGHPLTNGARFCTNCGKLASPPQPQAPVNPGAWANQEQKTAPYTVPVGQNPNGWNYQPVDPQKPGEYTVPLEPDMGQSWQQPRNQAPVYTEPGTEKNIYTEPVREQPVYTEPVRQTYETPISDPPLEYIQPPRRIRKLPILLGAIAAVLVLVLALPKLKDSRAELVIPGHETPAETTMPEAAKPEQTQQTQPEEPEQAWQVEIGELRVGEDSFTFTVEEYAAFLDQSMARAGLPCYVYNVFLNEENENQHHLTIMDSEVKNTSEGIHLYVIVNPATGKVTKVSFHYYTNMVGDWKKVEASIRCAVEAAHGALTEEKWQLLNTPQEEVDIEVTKITRSYLDNMKYEVFESESMVSYNITVEEPPAGLTREDSASTAAGSPSGNDIRENISAARSRHPEGTQRYQGKSFTMTCDDFVSLFQHAMDQKGLSLNVVNKNVGKENKIRYDLQNAQGKDVADISMTVDPATGLVTEANMTFYYHSDDIRLNSGFAAGVCYMQAAHGNMTEQDCEKMANTKPYTEKENYSIIAYELKGLRGAVTLRENRYFINIKPK